MRFEKYRQHVENGDHLPALSRVDRYRGSMCGVRSINNGSPSTKVEYVF